ncbi:MAG: hypothetical protein ABI566_04580 [Pseudolysinimonas sp.]
MRANAAKPPKGLDADRRTEWEMRRLAEAWERSKRAKRKGATWQDRWKMLPDLDGWDRCWIYLSTLVYRMKNDRHPEPQPAPGDLASALVIYVERHLSKFLAEPVEHADRLKGFQDFAYVQRLRVPDLAERVVMASEVQWKPDWIDRQRRYGAMSTSRGRPLGSGTFAAPEARARLRELLAEKRSHKEIAFEFGVSTKTVQRALVDVSENDS